MGYNLSIYDIPDDFSAMGLEVEVSKLHVSYCVYYFKCFLETKFTESSDQEVKRSGLGSDSVLQDTFNFLLVILMYF